MNEVAPSNKLAPPLPPKLADAREPQSAGSSSQAARVDSSGTLNPFVWALQLWTLTVLLGFVLGAGLSPALRGAFVGSERLIGGVDQAAALLSQVAAMCTGGLLIYMGLLSMRVARTLSVGALATLLGVAPTMMVFFSHRHVLPMFYSWVAAMSGAMAVLLAASQVRHDKWAQGAVAAAGFALFGNAFRTGGLDGAGSELFARLGAPVAVLATLVTVTLAALRHFSVGQARPLRAAIVIGLALLLSLTSSAAALPETPSWSLVVGRLLTNLAPTEILGGFAPFAVAFALLLVLSNLTSRPGSLTQLLCALLALGTVAPTSPLVSGWLTLCGYSLVVACFATENGARSPAERRSADSTYP